MVGPNDCDDVVMDTYLKVWRAIPEFRGAASLKTWLCKVLRNCALDYLRRRGRDLARRISESPEDEQPALDRVPDSAAPGPAREAAAHDLGRALDSAMQQLSDDHRLALVLREVDGLSYKEIAAATDVSIGTVMSRLFYAKKRLKGILQTMEVTP
jgi:RNA polymerase sigma-70 factor (ECF subfamily)